MPSFFQRVLTDAKEVEEEVLGPDYNYVNYIKTPEQLGMSDEGSLGTLADDVGGLIAYVELLATGTSKASQVNGPLGDKFFLETGAKCNDIATNKQVTRSLYINNVPDGSIPFLSSGMGVNFKDFRGLVPGVIGNLSNINPMLIFQAFVAGSLPDCQAITMDTIDSENNPGSKTAYVSNTDIQNMNPCWFSDGTNPVIYQNYVASKGTTTNKYSCNIQGFQNKSDSTKKKVDYSLMPDDPYVKLYYSALGIFGLYILMLIFFKKR